MIEDIRSPKKKLIRSLCRQDPIKSTWVKFTVPSLVPERSRLRHQRYADSFDRIEWMDSYMRKRTKKFAKWHIWVAIEARMVVYGNGRRSREVEKGYKNEH